MAARRAPKPKRTSKPKRAPRTRRPGPSKKELESLARTAVRQGRVSMTGTKDDPKVTLDGHVVRAPRVAEALINAIVGAWLFGELPSQRRGDARKPRRARRARL